MSPKMLFLAMACIAMVPTMSLAVVSPTPCATPCNSNSSMVLAVTTTINACSTAITATGAVNISWILTVLISVRITLIVVVIVNCLLALTLGVAASVIAAILYLILLLICNLINILLLYLLGVITRPVCRAMCESWYLNARAQLLAYPSTNIVVILIIDLCLPILTTLINACRANL